MKKSSVFTLTCTLLLTVFLFACDKEPLSNTQQPTENTIASEHYEFADTSAPSENQSAPKKASELTIADFKGEWLPLIATCVADSQEIALSEAFKTIDNEKDILLSIDEKGNFTLKIGKTVKEGKFTISDYNLVVTYSDSSPDTFLYIPDYRNYQTIKMQADNYYIYFYNS
ncbi:MAG: hypothetical protein IJU14_07510 [Clostridia bacterium]|nr:hypothetical protein [Clostridia bacterium]